MKKERTEKRMVELIERKRGTEGNKQLEEVKMEFINERLKEIWKENEIACRKIFEVMEMENIEQKQLIRLGKREEYKSDQYW